MADLTPSQLDTLRRLLNDREAKLQQEVRAANEEAAERPAALGPEVGDAIDSGDDRFQAGMAHVDKQRDQEELMAIEAARGRMSDGATASASTAASDPGRTAEGATDRTALRPLPDGVREDAPVGADVLGLRSAVRYRARAVALASGVRRGPSWRGHRRARQVSIVNTCRR